MGIAAYGKFTEAGIARRAAERRAALLPPPSATEPETAPCEATEPVSNVVRLVMPRDEKRRIIDLVARMHGFTLAQMMDRSGPVSRASVARQACMCAIKEAYPVMSLTQIGWLFDNRDHTCVVAAFTRRGFK